MSVVSTVLYLGCAQGFLFLLTTPNLRIQQCKVCLHVHGAAGVAQSFSPAERLSLRPGRALRAEHVLCRQGPCRDAVVNLLKCTQASLSSPGSQPLSLSPLFAKSTANPPRPLQISTRCPLLHHARVGTWCLTVDIVQWSIDSSEKRTASLMNTAAPRSMKEVKKWMWIEFLVQCSFLREEEVLCSGRGRENRWAEKLLLWEPLPWLDPSPGDHVLAVVKHKALEVFLL